MIAFNSIISILTIELLNDSDPLQIHSLGYFNQHSLKNADGPSVMFGDFLGGGLLSSFDPPENSNSALRFDGDTIKRNSPLNQAILDPLHIVEEYAEMSTEE